MRSLTLKLLGIVLLATFQISACNFGKFKRWSWKGIAEPGSTEFSSVDDGYRFLTIIGTNDIHGGVEPTIGRNGNPLGGMTFFSGAVHSIRQGIQERYGDRGGMILVDAGDQFQGTLISNYNEGQLVFATFNMVGYDAVVPGNHDYDFGPVGWLEDKVTPGNPDKNPRSVLENLARQAKFPLISANTYLKTSLTDLSGRQIEVSGSGCIPKSQGAVIQWKSAKRPEFLLPYVIKVVAGVRVALIGIDNVATPQTTTIENVSDLCFRDERETYLEIREELENQADVFVMVIHDGNTTTGAKVSQLVRKITEQGSNLLHVVVAGHTHAVHNAMVQDVPIIQSGSGGEMFGRVDLIWNVKTGEPVTELSLSAAGIPMDHFLCKLGSERFCTSLPGSAPYSVAYEGVLVLPDQNVKALISKAREDVAQLADRKLGSTDGELKRDRIMESSLANALTDALRSVSKTEVAILNTGGLRENLKAGVVTYEDLFKVMPFSNHGVRIGPMSTGQLMSLLTRSIRTCGAYGALMQSGLRVKFKRNCKSAVDQIDPTAKLLKVETLAGEVIFNEEQQTQMLSQRSFEVATLDFLAAGGSGYTGFVGIPILEDYGIVREAMVSEFLIHPAQFSNRIDGRWKQVAARNPYP